MAKNLEVKNLKISFRTNNGKVQAVRDISFDLERGKTLAIVGESGSGKSVTSRAIMGILAPNAIIEGGEIIYDGKDLLKISEEEMYKIRGDKIAMIFQDPLSSLNPIMRIGKQITEAMLLKNKASRRESRRDFNEMLALVKQSMVAADPENAARINAMTATFDKFCIQANRLENSYNVTAGVATTLAASAKDELFKAEKNQKAESGAKLKEYAKQLSHVSDPFFVAGRSAEISDLAALLNETPCKKGEIMSAEAVAAMQKLVALLDSLLAAEKPNFFCIGYYTMENPGEDLTQTPVPQLNEKTLAFLNDGFMKEFIVALRKGVEHSFRISLEKKKAVMPKLAEAKAYFAGDFAKADALRYTKTLCDQVEDSIDRLEIVKDSFAYTLRSGLVNGIERYFTAIHNNPKEEARFARQTQKQEAMIARGKLGAMICFASL